jgi:aldehyde:ferredoxin oxidoreductase
MLDRKLAIVDLSRKKVQERTIPKSWRRGFLGGRGINSYLLYNLIEKGTDPFSPRNALVLGVGPLGGTLAPSSSRFSASGLSPETGLLGDSNCGGFFGPELRYAGFDHLILRGKAKKPSYVNVQDGEIEVRDGREYWGMDTYEVQKALRKNLGDVESVVCGVAGENKVRFACLRTGVKNAAGRCGLGAVMGSKNVKAVVASGTDGIKVEHPEKMLEVVEDIKDYLMASKITPILGSMGTPLLYEISNAIGAIRTKNSQLNAWSDSLNAEELEKHVEKMISCSSCFMHCRHRNMFDGEGPEYTAVGLLGANLGLDDYPEVIKLNNTCNELGLDVSSSGTILSWAFELYERGIIDKKVTGQELGFGDFELADELLHKIARREGVGDILAESSRAVKKFGPKSKDYLIAIKNLPQSDPHDVRYLKAFSLGIAVASRGADHLRNRPTLEIFFRLPLEVKEKIYGKGITADPTSYEGKEIAVHFSDNIFATVDSVGICKFICHGFNSPHFLDYGHFSKLLHAVTGLRYKEKELENIGKRIIDTERLFNFKLGMTAKDDTLPKRYFDDPMTKKVSKGHKIDRKNFEKMKKRYYKIRNWDEKGRVKKQRVKEIESYGGLP